MIKVPNYNVVVPTVPDVRLDTNRRLTADGDRNALEFDYVADSVTLLQLPWQPTSPHWVEIYVGGIRLVNPRTTSFVTGQQYEVYNVIGDIVKFTQPVTGNLKFICDTAGSHHYSSLIIGAQNVQAYYETKTLYDFIVKEWPVEGGQAVGTQYRVNYKPGPDFLDQSYVIIKGCIPTKFNGNFQVVRSTPNTVYFTSNITPRINMIVNGTITGLGNVTVNSMEGIGLYSEPVILHQPYHGYVRLSTDRRSMAYVPDRNYVGNDTFSWSLINQHGQIGEPKCCVIRVRL